jgi:hypothetical protein
LKQKNRSHIEEKYEKAANKYQTGRPYIDFNFGIVEIIWEQSVVALSIRDKHGNSKIFKLLRR